MQHSDRDAFVELLTQCLGFYGQAVSPFAVSVWWQACSGCDIEQVRKALTAHAMDPDRGQWAPKPADIVRQLHGTQTDRSLIAWGKVLDAARRVGAYQSVVFDDAAIHSAITDLGGWPAFCRTTVDELPFLQRRFTAAHQAYSTRPGSQHPPRLVGAHEAANMLTGRSSAPAVLIGDQTAARWIEVSGRVGTSAASVPVASLPAGVAA